MSRSKSIAIRTHAVSYSSRNKAVVVLAEQILIVLKIPLNHLSLKMPCMLCYPGEHSIGDIKPSIGGCWLLISLCMGDNHSFGDSTQRVSVNRNGGKCNGPLKKSCPPRLRLPFQVIMEDTLVGEHFAAAARHLKVGLSFVKLLVWVPSHVF